jgi:hypothetical protein
MSLIKNVPLGGSRILQIRLEGEAIDTACENCHLRYWYPPSERAQKAKEGAGDPRKQ